MKKSKVQWIFNNHSTERFFERTALNVTKKNIAKAINNHQTIPFKRVNVTRSMTYIHVNGEVIKTVMHRKKDKIITILPWKSVFQYKIEFCAEEFDDRHFRVNIFPDCYLETKYNGALTKIFEWHPKMQPYDSEGYQKIQFNHPLFDKLFNMAWKIVLNDQDHLNIQKERKAGNETFEIGGKAKEIKDLVIYAN